MKNLLRLIRSDFMKMRHTSFYYLHICLPIIGVTIFLAYYSFSPWNTASKVSSYLQILAIAFPVIIGVVCEMVIEKEAEAGKFKEMLSTEYGRGMCLLSKIMLLLLSSMFSIAIAIGGFFIGFQYILKQNPFPFRFYIIAALVFIVGEISIYLIHIWLSIKFGSGASIGMGIVEFLVSGLFVTSIGDNIWKVVPCSWTVRLVSNFFIKESGTADEFNHMAHMAYWIENSKGGMINCIIFTIIIGILLFMWFNNFEGRDE